jgi:predicted ATP-dependent protease
VAAAGFLESYASNLDLLKNAELHVCVGDGNFDCGDAAATDGGEFDSVADVGAAAALSLISLALGRGVRPDLAVAGIISANGELEPANGYPSRGPAAVERILTAARAAGSAVVVLPAANRDDVVLPYRMRSKESENASVVAAGSCANSDMDLEIHFCERLDELFEVAFCEDTFFDVV